MALEHRTQESGKGLVPFYYLVEIDAVLEIKNINWWCFAPII